MGEEASAILSRRPSTPAPLTEEEKQKLEKSLAMLPQEIRQRLSSTLSDKASSDFLEPLGMTMPVSPFVWPVGNVTWDAVQLFIRKLNALEGGMKYRLPTEAEWEYAARAGSTTAYSFGDDHAQLPTYGWCGMESLKRPQAVGLLRPNAWGLYDMHGNLWEWVQDWFGPYPHETNTDPQGPSKGEARIQRGGSWQTHSLACKSAYRHPQINANGPYHSGYRILMKVI